MLGYGYCRYSSHLQDEKSIEQQKMEIEEYAIRNNIRIIAYYTDEAKSGTKNERDGFQNMISDACKNKEIECVLVWKTDRFARNTQDSLMYRNKLKKHGTKLISISQPIDDSSPEGKLMSIMLAGMDEYYSENLASNIRRAQKLKARNFEFNGGTAPLGFNIVNKHYVINEKEAVIVKKIFNLYIAGHGLLDIADTLNKSGYTTKKGKKFGKNSIYEILSNEKYIGTYTFNKGYRHDRHTKRDDTIIIENVLPAIISKEDFLKVKEIRKGHKKAGQFKSKKLYLLSGIIVCGKCGANYTGRTSVKIKNGKEYKTGYYMCANRNKLGKCKSVNLKQEELENTVIKLLTEKLLNSSEIDELTQKINEQYKSIYNESFSEIDEIKAQIKDKENQIDNITSAIASGLYSPALLEKLQKLEDIKKTLEEQLHFSNNINKTPEIKPDMIKYFLKKDTAKLIKNTQAKEIIKKWIKKIEVYDDEIIVNFTIDGASSIRLVAGVRPMIKLRIKLNNIKAGT